MVSLILAITVRQPKTRYKSLRAPWSERQNLEFRVIVFNVFNTANFSIRPPNYDKNFNLYFDASKFGQLKPLAVPRSFRQINLRSSDYDSLPRFGFQEEPDARVTSRALAGLLGLLLPTIVIGGIALRRLRRYPLVESR